MTRTFLPVRFTYAQGLDILPPEIKARIAAETEAAIKAVARESKRAYYERNKDKVAEYQRAYYERNKDKVAEYKRAYYKRNKKLIAPAKASGITV